MEPRNAALEPEETASFLRAPSTTPSSGNRRPLEASSSSSSRRKIALLLALLASFAAALLVLGGKEDASIERAIEDGDVELRFDGDVIGVADMNIGDEVRAEEDSIGDHDDKNKNSDMDAEQNAASDNDEPTQSSSSISGNKKHLLGFHDASPQNFITRPIHYKPPGAGYPLRPAGGLHPVYYRDLTDESWAVADGHSLDHVSHAVVEGDYAWHSPYADPRLRWREEDRKKEEEDYATLLQEVRDTWGYWNFVDAVEDRPVMDWTKVMSRNDNGKDVGFGWSGEINSEEFTDGVWQRDDEYIKNFLSEARAHVTRVREAIYAEYGVATSSLTPDQLTKRDVELGVHLLQKDDPPSKAVSASLGVAWMHDVSYDALVKKLLNAMMTNDHFFVVLGGHSAAAGHGNNFHQSYMMQFQELMEPVFDRLGMVLVSANRAQGGMGTLQTALGGDSIYGPKDVMLWDSSMTENGAVNQELFHRQMLLTGHRVPILLDMGNGKTVMDRIHQEAGAHVGGITSGTPSVLATTKSLEQAETLPFALRHLFCDKGVSTCTKQKHKYDAHCWADRIDLEPPTKQNEGYGGQASWHPGNKTHQWVARKLSLLFLRALEEAINVWEKASSSDGNPLPSKYWHLSAEEKVIRDKLLNVDLNSTECGKNLKLPRLCSTPMRGATEWAPRHNPDQNSLRSLLKPTPNGYVPEPIDWETPTQVYKGRDPHFPVLKIPKGEVDVVAVARSIPDQVGKEREKMLKTVESIRKNSNGKAEQNKYNSRQLTSNLVPGEGWAVENVPAGYCDGTSNHECKREPSSICLMTGHNDSRGQMVGDGLSGWLTFQLKDFSQGIFAGRIQYWHAHNSNKRTEGWDAINNGRQDVRRLKAPPPPLPDDMIVKVAIDGVTKHSYNGTEFKELCEPHAAYNVPLCVLLDDEEMAKKNEKKDVELSLRIIGGGRESVLGITHVYYA